MEQLISNQHLIAAATHKINPDKIAPAALDVISALKTAGYQAYLVGGGVRDLLLKLKPKDFDIATDATPEQVKEVFPRCLLIGRRFRLAHVRMRGEIIEVATFRAKAGTHGDREMHNGRILRDNVWGSIEEDAERRDFTINALFYDPVDQVVNDYVEGYPDIESRSLRLIGDPETRYREDPVRLLRAIRFWAKLDLRIQAATEQPITALSGLLADVPPARLFEEVCKLFLSGHAVGSYNGLQRYGLLAELLPVLPLAPGGKQVLDHPLLKQAMINTDIRVRERKPVTPAFLFAALLWPAVSAQVQMLQRRGTSQVEALYIAADEVLAGQVNRIAIPRRFSSQTKQIWVMQPRFKHTKGKRAYRLLNERRFRAAYDFLLLRVEEDTELADLAQFWTEFQEQENPVERGQKKPTRRRRRRRRAAKPSQ